MSAPYDPELARKIQAKQDAIEDAEQHLKRIRQGLRRVGAIGSLGLIGAAGSLYGFATVDGWRATVAFAVAVFGLFILCGASAAVLTDLAKDRVGKEAAHLKVSRELRDLVNFGESEK